MLRKNLSTRLVVFFVIVGMTLPISPSILQNTQYDINLIVANQFLVEETPIYGKKTSEHVVFADGEIVQPDSTQSPIRKYFTTKKILWTFDDYWINTDCFPPHKGYGNLSEQIHSYGGYVGIMCPFIPSWIGEKFNNEIRNYSVVEEFSVYTSHFSQAYINHSLEFFNRSYIEAECHGWNHSEDLNSASLSYAYQIINFTLWNWYNNYHIRPRFWLGHNYDGNYNISVALQMFSQKYWTVYAEYFVTNNEELFPNNIEPAVDYIGLFLDPLFGCSWGHPCESVEEAQQLFTSYAQTREIIGIRGHPYILNGSTPRATENLSKWQQWIDWIYQTHALININHTQAIEYKVDRNNFTVIRNSPENYTISLANCEFDHTVLFTNPDGTNQYEWALYNQTGAVIGVVCEDVFLPLKHGEFYYLLKDAESVPESPGWWNPSWTCRKELTIDHTKIASSLSHFPFLVRVTDTDLQAKAQPDGGDIVFTDENSTQLHHEIESYEDTTGSLTAWVDIPSLSATLDTTLYMYYNNPSSENQQDTQATWNSQYLAVHHLSETSGLSIDSTSFHNDGTIYGSPVRGVPGRVDGAVRFDGVGDHITLPQVYSTQNQFTMEAWIYAQAGARYFISQRSSSGVFLQITGDYLQYYINGVSDGKTVSLNTWYHVVLTYDGSTARLYINGVVRSKSCAAPSWPAEGLVLGDRSAGSRQFLGVLDEVRFSDVARSSGWVITCYRNQNNPASFITIGPEEVIQTGQAPVIVNPQPPDGAHNIPVNLSYLCFLLSDPNNDSMNCTVTTTPDIIGGSYQMNTVVSGTTLIVPITTLPLSYDTPYLWHVNSTDGTHWCNVSFHFRTIASENTWPYRKPITIDHTKISVTLTQFPLLLTITDADLASKAQDNGNDIYFTDSNNVKLPHELERFNGTTGALTVWVSIPSLSSSSDTLIYMYYGNLDADNQENIEATWDSSFLAVHHLSETSGLSIDSTSSHNDGTIYGSPVRSVAGRVDGAVRFDGVGDHITLPQVYSTQNQFTMEAWIYAQAGARYFISQRSSSGVFLQITGDYLQYYINGVSDGKTVSLNTWYHVVLTYDGSTARLYLNGVVRSKSCAAPSWPAEGLVLGDRSAGSRQFLGILDEIRFSNIARSSGWVTTCYKNQNNPASFISIGSEES